MNIFVLSKDPEQAAQYQCDKHVVKMIVESAQMLSTTHRMLDGITERRKSKSGKTMVRYWRHPDPHLEDTLYKAVHMNHPCTVWTRESASNYRWHYDHFVALCDEYSYRYGRVHRTDELLRNVLVRVPDNITDQGLTRFALAMKANPECIYEESPVLSYRLFYQTKKNRFKMDWTRRERPQWFIA